jgi:hypothetical protein
MAVAVKSYNDYNAPAFAVVFPHAPSTSPSACGTNQLGCICCGSTEPPHNMLILCPSCLLCHKPAREKYAKDGNAQAFADNVCHGAYILGFEPKPKRPTTLEDAYRAEAAAQRDKFRCRWCKDTGFVTLSQGLVLCLDCPKGRTIKCPF